MLTPLTLAVVVVLASIAAALVALILMSALPIGGFRYPVDSHLSKPIEQAVFLFDDRELVDATGPARALLNAIHGPEDEWSRLSFFLAQRLSSFDSEMASLAKKGEVDLRNADGTLKVHAEWLGQIARITVADLTAEGQGVLIDALSHKAQESELAELRELTARGPAIIWRTDEQGDVVWANDAYFERARGQASNRPGEWAWPLPALFPATLPGAADNPRRQKLSDRETGLEHWFDCYAYACDRGQMHYAVSADAAVKAEVSLREFVQTLTKTFAHLPIGLAVFDRQRRLALFNPALVDLTCVGVEFLSSRPTLYAFLDRLRDQQVIPEPKDYSGWRQKMTELEQAASNGLYEETWTLPSGQTYQVIGRPHPDGAVAFLIEDITAEIALTRRFRTEMELGQAVIDASQEAIVVFSSSAELIIDNAAYEELWGVQPTVTVARVTVLDSIRRWQELARPDPAFGDIRDFAQTIEERVEWSTDLTLKNGVHLVCRVVPIAGGATLVGFCRKASDYRQTLRRAPRARREVCTDPTDYVVA